WRPRWGPTAGTDVRSTGPQAAGDAQVEPRAHEPDDAVELAVAETQPLLQGAPGVLEDLLAQAGEPARHRRAARTEEVGDALARDPFDEVQAEQGLVLAPEARERGLQRLPEVLLVAGAEVPELRVLRERLLHRVLSRAARPARLVAAEVQADAGDHDADPA